jgi:cobalamin biosynthesis protein CobD/CbiB
MRVGSAILADGVAVLAFATVGRLSHAEGLSLPGVVGVAWPFLAGGAVGTLLGRTWRRPTALTSGAWVWLGTLAGGMLLRWAIGGGVQVSFVIVAGVVLAVFMLGWRLACRVLRSRATDSSFRVT